MSAWVRLFNVAAGVAGLAACGSVQERTGDDAGGGGSDAGIDAGVGIDGAKTDAMIDGPPNQPVRPPSCVGLPATCGGGTDDCCNDPQVAGGTFFRSFDRANDPNSGNTSSPATISDFSLDKYEVTVGRFRKFVAAGQGTQASPPLSRSGTHPNILASGWDSTWNTSLPATTAALIAALKCDPTLATWSDQAGGNENLPINCISWYEAMAFCAWDGGYLPTEAEWNFAATGGGDQRAFPWSVPAASLTIDLQHASFNPDGNTDGPISPVGSRPPGDGKWGHSDLAGNVSEWTLDYAGNYIGMCTDCANLAPAAAREARGGSFGNGRAFLRTGFRQAIAPANGSVVTGMRCAHPPVTP